MRDWVLSREGNGLSSLMSGIWEVIGILLFVDGLRLLAARVRLVISLLVLIFLGGGGSSGCYL